MKLFCIPYSGGSANIYSEWKKRFAGLADVITVEYRGHGVLFSEGLYKSISELRDDLMQRYFLNNNEPFVIYGHSLGSLVAYEITCELKKRNCLMPEHVVFASFRPPHLLGHRKKYTTMSKEDFLERIVQLGNTPREVIENEELREIVYEILYADMKLVDDYVLDGIENIGTSISAFAGMNDHEAPENEINEWSKYTDKDFNIRIFNGDHFFAFKEEGREQLLDCMESLLRKYV